MAEVDITPQFGAELKDGFKPVNAWVTSGITWLDEIQQFYRERSAIEKEYSAKLSGLAKKYFEKKTKRQSVLSVGETPVTTPGSLECASMTTWTVQLNALESRAAEHDRFAAELVSSLAEPLKTLSARCEELRKQHAEYAAKIEKERDGSYADLKKSKSKYDGVCQEVENRRKKTDGSVDAGRQKAQSAYRQQLSDMYNAKNSYLISINVTNKQKEKYYHEYVPELLDSLQDLSESRVAKLNTIWLQAADIETTTLIRGTEVMKHVSSEIPRNTPTLDSMMFVRHNTASFQDPADFVFEPSPVWLDDDGMVATDHAKTFLQNVLGKSKGQLSELRLESDRKRKELEGLQRTRDNIRQGKDNGNDEVETAKGIFALQEQYHDAERKRITAEVEVATIISAVGDVSVGARNHNFKSQTYKIPTNCDLCGERLWGLSAKGFDCQDCGFTCHSKCQMKVPASCPGELDKEGKRKAKVQRQEEAHAAPAVNEEVIPERKVSVATPSLQRQDTVNSMNTLSSGYAASANRSVSGHTPTSPYPDEATAGALTGTSEPAASLAPSAAAVAAPRPSAATKPRVLAPPPKSYAASNGHKPRSSVDMKGKLLYAYKKNGDGELTVGEGKEVAILEPDDGSGWTKVRAGYQEGLVPTSYLEMTAVASDTTTNSDAERPSSTYSASSASLAGSITGAIKKKGPVVPPKRGAKKLKQVEALYDYSARSDVEFSMTEGDRFVLVNMEAGDGWADVERGGVTKSVPANYLQEV